MKALITSILFFTFFAASAQEWCTVEAFGGRNASFKFDFGQDHESKSEEFSSLKLRSTTDVIMLMQKEGYNLEFYSAGTGEAQLEKMVFRKREDDPIR
ncbi:MAG: hypothetical protein DHS20C17_22760 [Cyclobacteriaceae bacterium]|nr:MAG: hypothetical protein DHS20C17_22760 [Cyclobacteriaceae bacterium]